MSVATATRRVQPMVRATPVQLRRYFAEKLAAELGPHNVKRLVDEGHRDVAILDVRPADAFREGHIPGAINIPFEEIPSRLKELPKGREIISYCWDVTCLLCTKAAYVLASKGYQAREMIGGMDAWQKAGFPVERG